MATTAGPVTTEELFNAAVDVIRDLPKNGSFQPSNQLMLRFYGFYKQATEGPCHNAKPAFWDVVGRAKWGAWNKLGTMPKEEAMKSYIEELKKQIFEVVLQRRDETALECAGGLTAAEKAKIVETMAYTENIDRFMEILEPFYEFMDIGDKSSEPEELSNGHDYPPSLKGAANGVVNGDNNNLDTINSIHNGHSVHLTKESLSEKYLSDSDSDNEEYGDPIEAHVDDIKLLKQGLLDHNDNDSGYADHVTYSLNRDAQNGSDHALLDNTQNSLWGLYNNGKMNDVETPSPQHLAHDGSAYVNGDNDFLLREKISPQSGARGLVARGGGDENGATGGGSLGQRRTSQTSDIRGQGHRDNLNQPHTGLLAQRPLTAGMGGGGRGGPGRGITSPEDISEQIAMALLRLQRDMDSVLARLNVLETVALAQHNTAQDRLMAQLNMQSSQVQLQNNSSRPSWWPFKELSCRTVLFILSWPIVLHLLMKFIANRRARRLLRKL